MCPHTENSFVPVLFGLERDIFLYHAGPFVRMGGTAASVSTLLIVVGSPNTPKAAGNGGLMRGLPRFPSIEFIMAVSSPQMYAPAQPGFLHRFSDRRGRHRLRLLPRFVAPALHPTLVGARLRVAEVLGEEQGLLGVGFVRVTHYSSPPRIRNAEGGTRNISARSFAQRRSPCCSAFRIPRSAFRSSAFRVPRFMCTSSRSPALCRASRSR